MNHLATAEVDSTDRGHFAPGPAAAYFLEGAIQSRGRGHRLYALSSGFASLPSRFHPGMKKLSDGNKPKAISVRFL